MKDYIGELVDLTADAYLNPDWPGHHRNENQITSIAVHHDAQNRPHDYDSVARYKAEAALHYQNLGPGLMYHYKIDNTGAIFKVRPHTLWLHSVGSAENVSSISICLDGYFHPPQNQLPTKEQYEALYQLLESLCEQHPEFPANWPDVRPHRDFSATACPGDGLANDIYPIVDKATAEAHLLNKGEFDWPEMQPNQTPPATPATPPSPPDPTPVSTPTTDAPKDDHVEAQPSESAPEAVETPVAPDPTPTTPEPPKTPQTGSKWSKFKETIVLVLKYILDRLRRDS